MTEATAAQSGLAANAAAAGRRSDLKASQARAGYLFAFPALALYTVFVLAPVILTVILSFAYYDPQLGSHWVGFDNFRRFFTDPRSVTIFWNTLRFTLFAVTGNVTVGLLLALALNRVMPGWLLYFFRLAFFLPVIIAAAFVSIVWGYFYQDNGIFNYYLTHLGLPAVRWLTSAQNAMGSIVVMDVWKNTGFFMIIFIAALQGVPKTIVEAAIMDGASPWRRFWRITLPWISPVVFFAIVYASIGALQVYESIYILTRGGPGDATRSMSINIVEEAFGSFQIGYGASVAVVMTVVILIITVVQMLVSRRLVHY
jgi:multiple sugar transport system permease protein